MIQPSEAFAVATEHLLGTPFRLHGRDPATGVDCIGLVHCALEAIGRSPPVTGRYSLRNLSIAPLLALLPQAGFVSAEEQLRRGDLLLLRPSAGQFHLGVADGRKHMIHAHAGLGLVCRTRLAPVLDICGRWSLT